MVRAVTGLGLAAAWVVIDGGALLMVMVAVVTKAGGGLEGGGACGGGSGVVAGGINCADAGEFRPGDGGPIKPWGCRLNWSKAVAVNCCVPFSLSVCVAGETVRLVSVCWTVTETVSVVWLKPSPTVTRKV